ncbi:hypothetical protein FA13DRAFT_490553 [Coprinellus micaceus]|uniref:Uncharacterized protein n=1 Tax=Coprinellus micaceus TaxID=71717 RepID=A0A4Y7SCJ6_COPMI|nr:hypothetical protein FA13DRAFT_490553 [Coprinellus micaceus]
MGLCKFLRRIFCRENEASSRMDASLAPRCLPMMPFRRGNSKRIRRQHSPRSQQEGRPFPHRSMMNNLNPTYM